MCTAIQYRTKDQYFGRTLDYEISYREAVVITPRGFPFVFPDGLKIEQHYAIIGIACVAEGYPLYYDAVNEKGLAMAGLLFDGNTVFQEPMPEKEAIPQYAFLPWLLSQCATVAEAEILLQRCCITDMPFSEQLQPSPLHWMLADTERNVVIEATAHGLQIYENPVGVLTNNPPFSFHLQNLAQYRNLTAEVPPNRFSEGLELPAFSRGMGALGLPGDLSSPSRFVRAAFVRNNAVSGMGELESVSQFFHILGAVEQQKGCVHLGKGVYERTLYTSCCNQQKGIYYYTTYENRQITAIRLTEDAKEGEELRCYPLRKEENIFFEQ